METRRERVLKALNFQESERLPKDLGGMRSTGISCFAYPALRAALGLHQTPPKIHDGMQMLAVPDLDVLDALDCDVVFVEADGTTNAFETPEAWKPYGFNGKLAALVRDPAAYTLLSDGRIELMFGDRRCVMASEATVFDEDHGGQPLDFSVDIPMKPIPELRKELAAKALSDTRIRELALVLKRVRSSTDRAVFLNCIPAGLGYPGGMANWSMLCLTEPDYVAEYHEATTDAACADWSRLLPEIAGWVDIVMTNADDQGTQNSTILPPASFRELYVPFYKKVNATIHRLAPGTKSFLHSCGAIYEIIDDLVDAGFDVLNPVQWNAGGKGYEAWKDKARGRIALWGGGVDTQRTLPLGSIAEVEKEVREIVSNLRQDSGFVFCAVHNIMANIEPDKIIAMYRAASE
jgi:uroporphyrinogen decarboxylase